MLDTRLSTKKHKGRASISGSGRRKRETRRIKKKPSGSAIGNPNFSLHEKPDSLTPCGSRQMRTTVASGLEGPNEADRSKNHRKFADQQLLALHAAPSPDCRDPLHVMSRILAGDYSAPNPSRHQNGRLRALNQTSTFHIGLV